MNERIPAEVFHPSVFIQEEMDERGWDRDELAIRMTGPSDKNHLGVTRLSLDFYFDIGPVTPGLRIGAETAEMFAQAFGVSPQLFLNLESYWLKYQK
jgi:plasmid maintenance system antidote protein VapI